MIDPDVADTRVLVVEDDPDLLALIGEHLHNLGCQVSAALSGEEALTRAFADPPDVAIVDIMLPSMNGHAVIDALRADERTAGCHVIVTSVLDAQDMSGGDAILAKPFRLTELTDALHRYARDAAG